MRKLAREEIEHMSEKESEEKGRENISETAKWRETLRKEKNIIGEGRETGRKTRGRETENETGREGTEDRVSEKNKWRNESKTERREKEKTT